MNKPFDNTDDRVDFEVQVKNKRLSQRKLKKKIHQIDTKKRIRVYSLNIWKEWDGPSP